MIALDLTGKVAIITGSGQGLGRVTAELLHQAGASVIINYFDDEDGVNRSKAESTVAVLGRRAMSFSADVRDPTSINVMMDFCIAHFGTFDILVNNAGVIRDKTLKKISPEDWSDVVDTNLTGVFNCCKSACDRISDGGRIVNLASISAAIGFYGQVNYAASKSGVIGLTKVLSRELAKRQITVNAVAPGVVLTEMGRAISEEARKGMLPCIPLGRFGESHEIAAAILFLCSSIASYITGQTLHVNGGWWG
jgi:3-oxoacyl-[acyl-carrier protein] reductase